MKKVFFMLASAALLFCACNKDEDNNEENNGNTSQPVTSSTAIVLNEGAQNTNSASLSLINLVDKTIDNGFFTNIANGRDLGDVAQDIIAYGNKVYTAVWGSNTIEVYDRASNSVSQISMGNRGPRQMVGYEGKIYVTCYTPHSVVSIDTATMSIAGTCNLSDEFRPEGICVAGGKIVAASTFKDDYSGYDNHLYVIDPATFSVSKTIEVGYNPNQVVTVDNNHVAVSCWGDYGENAACAMMVNIADNSTQNLPVAASKMVVLNNSIYCYAITYNADWSTSAKYYRIDTGTLSETEILGSCNINNPYGMGVNPYNGNIYIMTDGNYAVAGDVHCFDASGSLLWTLEAGMLPSKIIFL